MLFRKDVVLRREHPDHQQYAEILCVSSSDHAQWQFISGGGENSETPLNAAKRETLDKGGIRAERWIELKSLAYILVTIISEKRRRHWGNDNYVIPEYAFGFACFDDIRLSHEHIEYIRRTYEEAIRKLKFRKLNNNKKVNRLQIVFGVVLIIVVLIFIK